MPCFTFYLKGLYETICSDLHVFNHFIIAHSPSLLDAFKPVDDLRKSFNAAGFLCKGLHAATVANIGSGMESLTKTNDRQSSTEPL